jgi:hypothetical protein
MNKAELYRQLVETNQKKLDENLLKKAINTVQTVGDVVSTGLSFIPVVGQGVAAGMDLLSAGVDLAQGEKGEAALRTGSAALSLVPVGGGAAKAGMLAGKLGKAAVGATKVADAAGSVGKVATQVAKQGGKTGTLAGRVASGAEKVGGIVGKVGGKIENVAGSRTVGMLDKGINVWNRVKSKLGGSKIGAGSATQESEIDSEPLPTDERENKTFKYDVASPQDMPTGVGRISQGQYGKSVFSRSDSRRDLPWQANPMTYAPETEFWKYGLRADSYDPMLTESEQLKSLVSSKVSEYLKTKEGQKLKGHLNQLRLDMKNES